MTLYYGTQSAHALMERTTWHAAQHLRQLADDDLAGLPFPPEVWS